MAKKKEEEKKVVERSFVVGLQAVYNCPRPKRANKAIFLLKKFAFKHFRIKPEDVLISNKVNELIWKNGRQHVPRKIAIKVIVSEGKANIFLKGEKAKAKEEKKKEVKKEEKLTVEEKKAEEEKEKKKAEKKLAEKSAEKAAMKRGKE